MNIAMMNDMALAIAAPSYVSRTIDLATTCGPAAPIPHMNRQINKNWSDGASAEATAAMR